jgi:hypothetical protein
MFARTLICIFLVLHWQAYAQTPSDNPLFNTFKQGPVKDGDNGAVVAVVKAAIGALGVNNVFVYVTNDEVKQKYIVTLRDGQNISLKYTELQEAATSAGFSEKAKDVLSADIRKYGIFCFAVMAKNLKKQAPDATYTSAIATLNKGYSVEDAAALLGLKLQRLKPCTIENLSHYNHIIVMNRYYTAYANTGYYDELNLPAGLAALDNFRQNHNGFLCKLSMCNISEAYRIEDF